LPAPLAGVGARGGLAAAHSGLTAEKPGDLKVVVTKVIDQCSTDLKQLHDSTLNISTISYATAKYMQSATQARNLMRILSEFVPMQVD